MQKSFIMSISLTVLSFAHLVQASEMPILNQMIGHYRSIDCSGYAGANLLKVERLQSYIGVGRTALIEIDGMIDHGAISHAIPLNPENHPSVNFLMYEDLNAEEPRVVWAKNQGPTEQKETNIKEDSIRYSHVQYINSVIARTLEGVELSFDWSGNLVVDTVYRAAIYQIGILNSECSYEKISEQKYKYLFNKNKKIQEDLVKAGVHDLFRVGHLNKIGASLEYFNSPRKMYDFLVREYDKDASRKAKIERVMAQNQYDLFD